VLTFENVYRQGSVKGLCTQCGVAFDMENFSRRISQKSSEKPFCVVTYGSALTFANIYRQGSVMGLATQCGLAVDIENV